MSQTVPTQEFANLLTSHQRRLFGYIANFFPCPDETEDVLQQVNVVLWAKAEEFQLGTSFHSWALRVAHFEVLAQLNRKQRDRRVFSAELLDVFAEELTDEKHDAFAAVRQALRACLDRLQPADRSLVVRHYFDDLPVKQLAAELGRQLGSVYRSLNRVRNLLLLCIEEQEKTPRPKSPQQEEAG